MSTTYITSDYNEGFEGPEKTLHLVFEPAGLDSGSLRSVSRERWQEMLDVTRCLILSVMSNDHCDSFVLSESSLFVYDSRVILKTCGTTRLLLGMDDTVAIAESVGLRLRSVYFTRKNFTFPDKQVYPHTSFADERAYLDARCSGRGAVIGPLSHDHWYFYVADLGAAESCQSCNLPLPHPSHELSNGRSRSPSPVPSLASPPSSPPVYGLAKALPMCGPHGSDSTVIFEVKMHEIDPQAAAMFYRGDGVDGKSVTRLSGIDQLIPGQSIDEHLFDPCGYSMNGLLGPWYSTIHITPEEHCSFASFETNMPMQSYNSLLAAVLAIFRPSTFTVYVMSCDAHRYVFTAPGFEAVGTSSTDFSVPSGIKVSTATFMTESEDSRRRHFMERRLIRGAAVEEAVAKGCGMATGPSLPCGIPAYV